MRKIHLFTYFIVRRYPGSKPIHWEHFITEIKIDKDCWSLLYWSHFIFLPTLKSQINYKAKKVIKEKGPTTYQLRRFGLSQLANIFFSTWDSSIFASPLITRKLLWQLRSIPFLKNQIGLWAELDFCWRHLGFLKVLWK